MATDAAMVSLFKAELELCKVGPGQTVTFEFRADQPGSFPIYCSLRQDDGCRQMRGELIVRRR